jgi:hypothetical protein
MAGARARAAHVAGWGGDAGACAGAGACATARAPRPIGAPGSPRSGVRCDTNEYDVMIVQRK